MKTGLPLLLLTILLGRMAAEGEQEETGEDMEKEELEAAEKELNDLVASEEDTKAAKEENNDAAEKGDSSVKAPSRKLERSPRSIPINRFGSKRPFGSFGPDDSLPRRHHQPPPFILPPKAQLRKQLQQIRLRGQGGGVRKRIKGGGGGGGNFNAPPFVTAVNGGKRRKLAKLLGQLQSLLQSYDGGGASAGIPRPPPGNVKPVGPGGRLQRQQQLQLQLQQQQLRQQQQQLRQQQQQQQLRQQQLRQQQHQQRQRRKFKPGNFVQVSKRRKGTTFTIWRKSPTSILISIPELPSSTSACPCPQRPSPSSGGVVCGEDGRTYLSQCHAACRGQRAACPGRCPCPEDAAADDGLEDALPVLDSQGRPKLVNNRGGGGAQYEDDQGQVGHTKRQLATGGFIEQSNT